LDLLALEDDNDNLPRNVGKELPVYAAWYSRRVWISYPVVSSKRIDGNGGNTGLLQVLTYV